MPVVPQMQEDRWKTLRLIFGGAFFVLVLIEKSMGFNPSAMPSFPKQGFKNLGKQKSTQPALQSDPFLSPDWEDDLSWEEEVFDHSIKKDSVKTQKHLLDEEIPQITLPEDRFPGAGKKLEADSGWVPIYFLKFYGSGKNSQSQLVKLTREFPGGDPISFIVSELSKGPTLEEKSKGVISAVPRKLPGSISYSFESGTLHLSLPEELTVGGSNEILKDRIDQFVFSLVGNYGIRGVILYSNGERLRTLGSDGLGLPHILVKNQRKVLVF